VQGRFRISGVGGSYFHLSFMSHWKFARKINKGSICCKHSCLHILLQFSLYWLYDMLWKANVCWLWCKDNNSRRLYLHVQDFRWHVLILLNTLSLREQSYFRNLIVQTVYKRWNGKESEWITRLRFRSSRWAGLLEDNSIDHFRF